MDFSVCPGCGQSVLDDDAENCPFCGVSMKGKPGGKPAAPATKAPAPSRPAAKTPAKSTAKSTGEDLPFGVPDAAANVVATATMQPTKGRSLKVVCPMCETEGYVPSGAAGKEIKCANPKCMVPVFTAPLPEPEPVAPPPPKKSGNLVFLGVGTTVAVAGIGAVVWFVASQPSGDGVFVKPVDLSGIPKASNSNSDPATQSTADKPGTTPQQDASITPAPQVDTKSLVNAILTQCQQSSLLSGSRNRSKAYSRRLSAEAHALGGDAAGARQQIEALAVVGTQLPYYQVTPWVELYWLENRLGNAAAAEQALKNAEDASTQLPNRGRDQLDVATRLAVALVSHGDYEKARKLVEQHQTTELDGEVSAQFMWLAHDATGRNADWLQQTRPIIARATPQMAAVTACTVLVGNQDSALAFLKSLPPSPARDECQVAWAEAVAWRDPLAASDLIAAELLDASPASATMVWARAARVAQSRKATSQAQSMVQQGTAALAKLTAPESYSIPEVSTLARTRPTLPAEWSSAAAAAAELAAAQLEIHGQPGADTVRTLDLALAFTRVLGPSVPAISTLVDAANRSGPTGLRNELKSLLDLRTDDQARIAMGEYRRSLSDLEAAAQTRFQLQTVILTRLAELGLDEEIWKIVARVHAAEAPEERENFLSGPVAEWLAERFQMRGDDPNLKMLNAARSTSRLPAVARPVTRVFADQIAAGEFSAAWQTVNQSGVRPDLREALVLRSVVSQAFRDAPVAEMWSQVGPITDVVLREQAVEWGSWMASRRGATVASNAWAHSKNMSSATELISLGRGVVAGVRDLQLTEAQAAPTQNAPTQGDSAKK